MAKVQLIRIGSSPNNDIVINHDTLAEYHLELFQDMVGDIFVTDLNTINGTFVNDQRVDICRKIVSNDIITIAGKFKFEWMKLIDHPKVNPIFEPLRSGVYQTENKDNSYQIDFLLVDESIASNAFYEKEVESNEDEIGSKLKYVMVNYGSVIAIFTLNFILFMLFYFAFLS